MSCLDTIILSNTYRDSVFLMKISAEVAKINGVIEAAAMMATERNKDLFEKSNLSNEKVCNALSDDLVISVRAENEEALQKALSKANEMLSSVNKAEKTDKDNKIKTLEAALQVDKEANVLLISCAGDYAKYEAVKGLNNGLNIMLYSDNISVEDELALKQLAHQKQLIVMGPDCGSSIINGVPLAFANRVGKGPIGVVGASGTGIQEVTSLLDRYGCGITQAFGTGGRDPKEEINGITMMDCLEIIKNDPNSKVILIVSKPPCKSVLKKIIEFIKSTEKPVVVNFAGEDDYSEIVQAGGYYGKSLEETAMEAYRLATGKEVEYELFSGIDFNKLNKEIANLLPSQKYLRAIYSGGSLCYEAMAEIKKYVSPILSNTPLKGVEKLEDVKKSRLNTFLDIGDDEFTVGKPHPMIDPTIKCKRLEAEISDEEVAIVLTDCVIGYGSCDDPAKAIAEAINEKSTTKAIVVASVCGTQKDYQIYSKQVEILRDAGVYVAQSNYQAAKLCEYIFNKLSEAKNEG
ncbi:MAG: acyl-CoA synthetase FdrA [Erysipelotrichia bacterium]|nr:acyl-CoA synthetase FdrA [Erysipelotrichia bacterium]